MTKKNIGNVSLPKACICCMMASLLTKSVTVSARAVEEQAFLKMYTPDTNVDAVASLDLDQRSIVARVATGDEDGLSEAMDIYSMGRTDNDSSSAMTVKRLSTLAEEAFMGVSTTYQDAVNYYGDTTYADHWVSAAFGGKATSLSAKGNVDFGTFGVEGRAAAIRYGTTLLNVWMFVIGTLEKAVVNCRATGDNTISVSELDQAVALYTGSEARANSDGGYFLYSLTQVECYKFGTCKRGEMSPVNKKIFDSFRSMKYNLSDNQCSLVRTNAREIKAYMTVLLVQGVYRSMYELDIHDDFQESTQGMATAFAAALLPLVNDCSPGRATIIHKDLSPGESLHGSFEAVKDALVRSYECLEIKCEDVGGLIDVRDNGYLKGAEACGSVKPATLDDNNSFSSGGISDKSSYSDNVQPSSASKSNSSNTVVIGLASFAIAFGVSLGLAIACICMRKKKQTNEKELDTNHVTAAFEETTTDEYNQKDETAAGEDEPPAANADKEIV